jgi:flagellar hook protein FlgE
MSFQQGLSGLDVATKNLDVIGNNVANANTVGFKKSTAQFGDIMASSAAGSGSKAVGIGSTVSAVLPAFVQGNLTVTNNPLDIAINGQGFFRVSTGGAITFTRNGQFQLEKTGYITNSVGARLTGYPATATGTIVASAPTDLQVTTTDIPPTVTTKSEVQVNLDSRAATLAAASFNITTPATYNSSTSMQVYDSLGNAHSLSAYFVHTGSNTWSVMAGLDGTQIGAAAVGTIVFKGDGSLDTTLSTVPMAVSATMTNGAATPFNIDIDMTGSTQFGSSFGVNKLEQNGFASGRLSGFSVDDTGVVVARYSNGQTRKQGQVVLANFTDPQGLRALGANGWAETPTSGAALIGAPGTGNLGSVQSGAVEDSNVDLSQELVAMITAQRVYQANAQSIKTMDSVLQTLIQMR